MANRLPRDAAQHVISCVISLFEEDSFPAIDGSGLDFSQVSDSTWHGTCLAVAELARRGLLLPQMLPEIVPWIVKVRPPDPSSCSS